MIYLILYDITSNTLRNKVSKLLIQEGYERIQFSVFVGPLNPYKNKVWNTLKTYTKNSKTDNIICIKLNETNFLNMKILGKFTKDVNDIIGKNSTKIF